MRGRECSSRTSSGPSWNSLEPSQLHWRLIWFIHGLNWLCFPKGPIQDLLELEFSLEIKHRPWIDATPGVRVFPAGIWDISRFPCGPSYAENCPSHSSALAFHHSNSWKISLETERKPWRVTTAWESLAASGAGIPSQPFSSG